MNNHDTYNEEFEMLLNEVLDTLANPQPTDALQEKVTMRLRLAQIEDSEAASRPALSVAQIVLFANHPAPRRNFTSTSLALGLHAAAILLIAFLIGSHVQSATLKTPMQLTALVAPPPPVSLRMQAMGGGGGQPGVAPVSKGTPPKFAVQQLVPPKVPPIDQPKIAVEPAIDLQADLKMASAMPNIGMVNAPNVGISMGNGYGNGLGSGNGSGMGPGSGGNTGGGLRQVGGGVSAPIEIYRVEPEFSEEARKAKLTGNVLVNLWVDRTGRVTHVSVLKGLGMGLDEKAMEAVKQFRFKPAMENGKPVPVEMNIDVNFQIF
jgi:protein TonB